MSNGARINNACIKNDYRKNKLFYYLDFNIILFCYPLYTLQN